MVEVHWLDAAIDDLSRLDAATVRRVLKKVLLLEKNPMAGKALGGDLKGFRKLIVGNRDWRVIYRITADGDVEICEIWVVGARTEGEVYDEASRRIAALPQTPSTAAFSEVIAQLGRLAAGIHVKSEILTPTKPPDWLIARLVHTAGFTRKQAESMDLDAAMEAWVQYQQVGKT